jgi:DNA-binding CsgD family transcriptional regulator
MPAAGHLRLIGRDAELATLDRLLEAARAGEGGSLVVRGPPGLGKSALLEALRDRAAGCRVTSAAGMEAEMELPFAGLHQLCGPLLDRLDRIPAPQRDALATAFGLSAGPAPDRFLVGLAVLSLLSDAAQERSLVCLVDDAQWLDRTSAQVLAFVARRLSADAVALVFAARDEHAFTGLPELVVGGLSYDQARQLLQSAVAGPLDEQVAERIVSETRGNPLALLELPRGLTPDQLAGGFGLPDALPVSGRIERSFEDRLAVLPAESRLLLLVAAADPTGDPRLLWQAAGRLGVGADAVDVGGLCEFDGRVRFRHPLARSAVYRAASPEERRRAHHALAEATDPEGDPDRRAWHRAHATSGLDEEVAEELQRSAGRAQARGGAAAAAAFLARAADLTPDPRQRALRTLAAAQAKHQAGAFDEARQLLATADAGPPDEARRARSELLRGQIAFASSHGSDAPPLLLSAARRLERFDPELARGTYLEAFSATLFAGRLNPAERVLELAEAASALPAGESPRDLLLQGLARTVIDGFEAGAPTLKRALRAFRTEEADLWLASHCAAFLWDFDTWRLLASRQVELARTAGALDILPVALITRAGAHLLAGELDEAAALIEETAAIGEVTGRQAAEYGALPLAALQGREADAIALIQDSAGEGLGRTSIEYATAVLYNGLSRYDDALAAAPQPSRHPGELWSAIVLPERVEAAVRTGRRDLAGHALELLVLRTRASGTDWSLGILARTRALLNAGEAAEALYRDAIERLGRAEIRTELARAQLVYGEWLRRERRRLDARSCLRTAHERFTAMGMEAFAERAGRELAATGATARKRTVDTRDALTAQEAQIARLARDGLSNPEIGARLFISPRTVQFHLRKVFSKLDISSRTQLHLVLASADESGMALRAKPQ